MKKHHAFAVVILAAAVATNTLAAPRPTIPAAFQGTWSDKCFDPDNITNLTITANVLEFYETSSTVTKITRNSANDLTLRTSNEGEGQVWTDTKRIRLSKDGRKLTVNGFTRKLCTRQTRF